MPKVSVICTNYNKGKWIADAIDSFLRQKTNFEFEIILVDDCSTDESVDIIRNYGQRYPDKIRTFFNSENQGIAKTWVAICKEARGQKPSYSTIDFLRRDACLEGNDHGFNLAG